MEKKKHIIEVDRQQYEATYIGKGQYSKAYRVGDRVVLYTKGDCAKEALAMFQYDRMAHLPELIQHDFIRGGQYGRGDLLWYVFSTPYYKNVTTKDKSAYELMMKIIKFYRGKGRGVIGRGDRGGISGVDKMQNFVDKMKHAEEHWLDIYAINLGKFPRSVIRALQELVDVSRNCGNNIGFDLKKSNFGVNEYGTLIFRDVIWVCGK